MAGKKLARNVTVGGKTYGPDDDVPAEVLAQIKNPKAYIADDAGPVEDPNADRDGGTSSGAKLSGPVTVGGRTYGPNDYVPDDVAAQIKNPKAWKDGKAPTATATDASGDKAGDGEGSEPGVAAPDTTDPKAPRKSTSSTPKRS
jgi:hypothetical protein